MALQQPARKKLVERERLRSFMHCMGRHDLPLPEDGESPDFLLPNGDHTIGVEITHMVSHRVPGGRNPRQTNHVLDTLTNEIRGQYVKQGGPPLHATIGFAQDFSLARRDFRAVAQHLAAEFIVGIRRAQSKQSNYQPLEISIRHPLVESLAVWPCRSNEVLRWHPRRGGMVDNATAEDVLATLQVKEEKLQLYRRKVPQVWLLIVCDLMVDGLFIDPPEEPVHFTVTTGFDRIFCLAWTGTRAVEVPVRRPEMPHC